MAVIKLRKTAELVGVIAELRHLGTLMKVNWEW